MRVPVLILFAAALASCSVKEARRDCPCLLEADLTAFAEVSRHVTLEVGDRMVDWTMDESEKLTALFKVPKTDVIDVTVKCGGVDSLFLFTAAVPGMEEKVTVRAVPHKQFARVLLKLVQTPDSGISYTVTGDYVNFPLPGTEGNYMFRLPRQRPGSSLSLDAKDADGNVNSFPLGEWILGAGYDWEATDLDDIVIGADFTIGVFGVTVGEWDAGDEMAPML